MANEFIARKGLIVSGSTRITGSLNVNAGITGSLFGTSSWADNVTSASYATTASAATSITFTPVTASYAITASYAMNGGGGGGGSGTVTSIDIGNGLTGSNDPITTTGDISLDTSSVHFTSGIKTKLNTDGVFSSSAQVQYGSISGVPAGIVSSSSQVSYTGLTGIPTGILSSSTQINALSGVSASFATTASAATSITFTPSTASFATTASYLTGTVISSSYAATASLLLGTVVSASYATVAKSVEIVSGNIGVGLTQYTGSFTGSLTGSLLGSSKEVDVTITPTLTNPYTVVASDIGKRLVMNGTNTGSIVFGGAQQSQIPVGSTIKLASFGANTRLNTIRDATFTSSIDDSVDSADYTIYSVATQSDNKILIGGTFKKVNDTARTGSARLNTDGTLDTSFPNLTPMDGGYVGDPYSGYVNTIAVQSDGKILLGGYFAKISGSVRRNIARLNSNGTVDVNFSASISASFDNSYVEDIKLQSDGKILVGGLFSTVNGTTRNRLARLNSDGTLDTGFQDPAMNSYVYSLAVQSDGKIVAGGSFTTVNGVATDRIVRLNSDGTTDTGFNSSANNDIYTLKLQSDGKIVIGGTFTTVSGSTRNRIARLNTDGTLDTSFPDVGVNEPLVAPWINNIDIQSDGKIVLVGQFTKMYGNDGVTQRGVARLLSNGIIDDTFRPVVSASVGNGNTIGQSVLVSGSSILYGGDFNVSSSVIDGFFTNGGLVRLIGNNATVFTPKIGFGGYQLVDELPQFAVTKLEKLNVNIGSVTSSLSGSVMLITETNVPFTVVSASYAP